MYLRPSVPLYHLRRSWGNTDKLFHALFLINAVFPTSGQLFHVICEVLRPSNNRNTSYILRFGSDFLIIRISERVNIYGRRQIDWRKVFLPIGHLDRLRRDSHSLGRVESGAAPTQVPPFGFSPFVYIERRWFIQQKILRRVEFKPFLSLSFSDSINEDNMERQTKPD